MESADGVIPEWTNKMNQCLNPTSEGEIGQYPQMRPSDPSRLWAELQTSAIRWRQKEPWLAPILEATILHHDNLSGALPGHLARQFAGDVISAEALEDLVKGVLDEEPGIGDAVAADLLAVRIGDPATLELLTPFLLHKSFAALCLYRVANRLWLSGRQAMACLLQQRCSTVTGIDVHPAASVGTGILMDHGTGIVIGETASISDDVTLFHNVTLGGTGRERGDRHPHIGRGVFIGAGATLLGRIRVGDWSRIGAGSVVLADVPDWSLAVGVPAHVVAIDEEDDWPDPRRQPTAGRHRT